MEKLEITNAFHGTSAKCVPILIADGRYKGYYRISRKTLLRLRNELCGSHDCLCSGSLGDRPSNIQLQPIMDNGQDFIFQLINNEGGN